MNITNEKSLLDAVDMFIHLSLDNKKVVFMKDKLFYIVACVDYILKELSYKKVIS